MSEKTNDQTIIDNAMITALNQDDLANLIHMDYKKIYLCGELFNVPIRMTDMNYIGILGTPKIKIKANSDEEFEAKNIKFENCQLPWQKMKSMEELKVLFDKIFHYEKWYIVKNDRVVSTYDKLDKTEKSLALKMLCKGKYTEDQIVYMQLTEDLASGFALTIDSFCFGGIVGDGILKYKDIEIAYPANNENNPNVTGIYINNDRYFVSSKYYVPESVKQLFGENQEIFHNLAKFLNIAKNL